MSEQETNQAQEDKEIIIKKGFFKKAWYSITKIEKYPEMATEGVPKAISYICKLIILLAIILSVWITYDAYKTIKNATNYLQNDFPEFLYKEGNLKVESNEPIIIDNKEVIGKIIVDTNTDSEEEINNYIKSFGQYDSGIIVLKNRVILTNINIRGSTSYNYEELLENMEITEFSKETLINYLNSNKIFGLYTTLYFVIFIYSFIMYLLRTLWYIIVISIVGYFAAWFLKIKMRYAPIFNMSVYAITLSVILNIVYLIINALIQ